MLFGDIFAQIIQFQRLDRGLAKGLVVSPANRLLKIFRKKFPVQKSVVCSLLLTEQGGQNAYTIDTQRRPDTGQLGERGHNVGKVPDGAAGLAGGNVAGPSGNHWCSDTALEQIGFITAQGT